MWHPTAEYMHGFNKHQLPGFESPPPTDIIKADFDREIKNYKSTAYAGMHLSETIPQFSV